ncbi:hypothetical protein V8E53_010872 [Lactarius tabidus]
MRLRVRLFQKAGALLSGTFPWLPASIQAAQETRARVIWGAKSVSESKVIRMTLVGTGDVSHALSSRGGGWRVPRWRLGGVNTRGAGRFGLGCHFPQWVIVTGGKGIRDDKDICLTAKLTAVMFGAKDSKIATTWETRRALEMSPTPSPGDEIDSQGHNPWVIASPLEKANGDSIPARMPIRTLGPLRLNDIWWVLTQEEDVDVAKGLAERGEKRWEGGMGHGTKDEKKKKDI